MLNMAKASVAAGGVVVPNPKTPLFDQVRSFCPSRRGRGFRVPRAWI